ncbi:hypothetical protein Cabys_2969 [Caldithrix abyssi DSM 13497]|uniref:Uncharacterized protein n=1 Tax=Caldithrix abyssi DSM 13497 TaxID=880073 RepID=A0A1J1CAK0_CALAY|nr:hypothetical protein Cabys_2969 [Caldithrix abyssi DSM 13497]
MEIKSFFIKTSCIFNRIFNLFREVQFTILSVKMKIEKMKAPYFLGEKMS